MRYLKNYKKFQKDNSVNEELLGGVINFFKRMWDRAIKELEALENDPNKIKEWIIKNALNPKDDTNVFSQVLKDFQAKKEMNTEDCLNLIDSILNPETGSLGRQGIGVLLNNKAMQGEKLKSKRAMLEYIINIARNKTIADAKVKFAGGPTDGKVDQKKINKDPKDQTHLPGFKKLLTPTNNTPLDVTKLKDITIKWVTGTLIPIIQNYVKSIREDDVRASLEKQGIKIEETTGGEMDYEKLKVIYDKKEPVIYLLKGKTKEEWDKLTDDQKAKPKESPANTLVGVSKMDILNDQNKPDSVSFKLESGIIAKKAYNEIIGPEKGGDKGPNTQELATSLGEIKSDETKMKQVSDYVKVIKDPEANKEKIDQINKIISGQ